MCGIEPLGYGEVVQLPAALRERVEVLRPGCGVQLVLECLRRDQPVGARLGVRVEVVVDPVDLLAAGQLAAVDDLQAQSQVAGEVAGRVVLRGDELAAVLGHLAIGEEIGHREGPSADSVRRLVDLGGDPGLPQLVGTAKAGHARADDDHARIARSRRADGQRTERRRRRQPCRHRAGPAEEVAAGDPALGDIRRSAV